MFAEYSDYAEYADCKNTTNGNKSDHCNCLHKNTALEWNWFLWLYMQTYFPTCWNSDGLMETIFSDFRWPHFSAFSS